MDIPICVSLVVVQTNVANPVAVRLMDTHDMVAYLSEQRLRRSSKPTFGAKCPEEARKHSEFVDQLDISKEFLSRRSLSHDTRRKLVPILLSTSVVLAVMFVVGIGAVLICRYIIQSTMNDAFLEWDSMSFTELTEDSFHQNWHGRMINTGILDAKLFSNSCEQHCGTTD